MHPRHAVSPQRWDRPALPVTRRCRSVRAPPAQQWFRALRSLIVMLCDTYSYPRNTPHPFGSGVQSAMQNLKQARGKIARQTCCKGPTNTLPHRLAFTHQAQGCPGARTDYAPSKASQPKWSDSHQKSTAFRPCSKVCVLRMPPETRLVPASAGGNDAMTEAQIFTIK